ncbi:MAG: TolB family protein [Dehalococcoidia bacterium]
MHAKFAGLVLLVMVVLAVVTRAHDLSFGGSRSAGVRGRGTIAGETFLFSTDTADSTAFWLADAENPSVRKKLTTFRHRGGWSTLASIAPNGQEVAFTKLPPFQSDPDHQAELWLLALDGTAPQQLASYVDLRSFLIWSPDSKRVTFQRRRGAQVEVWRQSIAGGPSQPLISSAQGESLIPIGYDREGGQLFYARLSRSGTDLFLPGPSGPAPALAHMADGPARGFTVSPDRSRVAYLARDGGGAPAYHARAVDLNTRTVVKTGQGDGEDIGVAWRPDGTLAIGNSTWRLGIDGTGGIASVANAGAGFDQPLAWAPSGRRLAMRRFSGSSSSEPGSAEELLLQADGTMQFIDGSNPVRFVGWVTPSRRSSSYGGHISQCSSPCPNLRLPNPHSQGSARQSTSA